ncbi:protein CapI [Candidatus Peregrinibacteria bacterium CG10_big_fil_rev_8_21_14_0_10_49_16]|nr:MAG: protein CapI [Candidatus Peregrinibacteria bacterium CG22_combo_CG10-13_8_21_14_all_49_11]PIR51690.1 MAG: protein CapI [Candidatus Peregrinibacteria bacterium CG10_big_fil_rev_8_21_14_0_10_49_16]
MNILLTGSAGFIGFHTAQALLKRGDTVVGLDNFNPYYDATLKEKRNEALEQHKNFKIIRGDIKDSATLQKAFDLLKTDDKDYEVETRVCHLAAQAGVRHSIEHPNDFIQDNILGFHTVIDLARQNDVGGLVYASTSAVYGDNEKTPFSETDATDDQASLYGMTKKANELEARVYHKRYGLHSTGLRFFTVYGPWGRPDMALFLFTDWILNNQPLQIFGEGKMRRDWTYVDDIVSGILSALDKNFPCEIFNLGGGHTEELMDFVKMIEECCGKEAEKQFLPMQPGDVVQTAADIAKAQNLLDYEPRTRIQEGIPKFVEWYREYYNHSKI